MELSIKWLAPFQLSAKNNDDLIYSIKNLARIPQTAGVYIFARVYGKNVEPAYIGQTLNLQERIRQHLTTNVKLMKKLQKKVPNGARYVYVAQFVPKQGQQAETALRVLEKGLIRAALAEGFTLLALQEIEWVNLRHFRAQAACM